MSLVRAITSGLRSLVHRDRADRDLDDEVRHYLELATEERMRAGLTRQQAEREARLAIGGVEVVKERVRSTGWESHVDTLVQDLRYAARGLRRNPGFAVASILTLALGIGANTAMFSVINAVMLRPLPYADPGRLAFLWTDDLRRGLHEEATAYRTLVDWQEQNRSFAGIGFFNTQTSVLGGDAARERVPSAFVSANLFSVLGTPPLLGRVISADDVERREQVAVISFAFWQRRFGGDPRILGTLLPLNELPKSGRAAPRVVGVMPPGFYFPDKAVEFWVPATTYWRWTRESGERFPPWARRWTGVGRLKPNVSVHDARADMQALGDRLARSYRSDIPDFPGFTANVVPILDHVMGTKLRLALWILLGAVGMVLLVACANVANLLLARGAARQQELAIRCALGAARSRLIRQLVVENLALATMGGVAGVCLAILATKGLALVAAPYVPRLDELRLDSVVLAFAGLVSIVAGLVFGLAPAFRMSSIDASEALKDSAGQAFGSRRLRRTRGLLVVAECSLAIVLLAGAGLLLRSLERLQSVDPGFDPSGVLSMRVALAAERATPSAIGAREQNSEPARASAREAATHELTERIRAIPGVVSAGFIDDLFIRGEANESITIPGRQTDTLAGGQLYESSVSTGVFSVLNIPLRAGRYLDRSDAATKVHALWTGVVTDQSLAEKERRAIAEPVLVNDAFVRRFFPGENPIGRRFCIDPTNKTYWYVIVGVVGNMRRQGLERQAVPEYFGSFIPMGGTAELLVRTRGDPLAAAATVRRMVTSALPGTSILAVTTADRRLGDFSGQRRFQTWLLGAFAAMALLLAAIGIYGVVHYAVAERTREIGLRVALGASKRDVLAMVLGQGLRMPILGAAVGLAAAALLTRTMAHLVFEIGTTDPVTFGGVALVLVAVAAAACYFPARRAARVDPMIALRQ